MPHLSHSVSGAIRTFSYWIANGTVGHPLLEGIDFTCVFREPSALEQVYATFANVLEFDENGRAGLSFAFSRHHPYRGCPTLRGFRSSLP